MDADDRYNLVPVSRNRISSAPLSHKLALPRFVFVSSPSFPPAHSPPQITKTLLSNFAELEVGGSPDLCPINSSYRPGTSAASGAIVFPRGPGATVLCKCSGWDRWVSSISSKSGADPTLLLCRYPLQATRSNSYYVVGSVVERSQANGSSPTCRAALRCAPYWKPQNRRRDAGGSTKEPNAPSCCCASSVCYVV